MRLALVVDTDIGAGSGTDAAQMPEESPLWEEQSMTGFPANYSEFLCRDLGEVTAHTSVKKPHLYLALLLCRWRRSPSK